MDDFRERPPLGWLWGTLCVALLASFFYNLGTVPLFDLDEGAFSEATREMFVRNDFISTFLNGQPRYDKPILIYWLQAASVSLLGLNEFALRLPSALAATAWVLVVLLFVRNVKDMRTALLAAIITATSLEVAVMAKAATADALLNLWIASAMLSIYLYYLRREARYLYLAYLAMALGFLTKGPVAVMIPLVVSLLFSVLRGEWRFWLRTVFHPGGIALFLLIAMPWYVVQILKDPGFIDGFFFKHNLSRFSSSMESHQGNIFYYVPVVLLGLMPFTSVLLRVFSRVRQLVRDDLQLYLLLWFGFVFVFFSLSGTKLPHYVVYGFTPLFILMAIQLDQMKSRFWVFLPPMLLFGLLLALPELLDLALPTIKDAYARQMLAHHREDFPSFYQPLIVVVMVILLWFMLDKRWQLSNKMLVSGILTSVVLSAALLPAIAEMQQAPIKQAALYARQHGLSKVVLWKLNTPSFNVYTEQTSEYRDPLPGEVVLTKERYLAELAGYQRLYSRNGVALVRLSP